MVGAGGVLAKVQLKDTEKVVLVDSGFSSTTDSLLGLVVGSWEPDF